MIAMFLAAMLVVGPGVYAVETYVEKPTIEGEKITWEQAEQNWKTCDPLTHTPS